MEPYHYTQYMTFFQCLFQISHANILSREIQYRIPHYKVGQKEWQPYNTKYCLFLIVLCKSYEKISHHWLGLDVANELSIPN